MENLERRTKQNSFNDCDDINFECITDFLLCSKENNFRYSKPEKAGSKQKDMYEISQKGKKAVNEFEKYARLLISRNKDYVSEKCSSWQNSGNLAKYLWIEFKKEEARNIHTAYQSQYI